MSVLADMLRKQGRCPDFADGKHRFAYSAAGRAVVCPCGFQIEERVIAMERRPEREGLREEAQ